MLILKKRPNNIIYLSERSVWYYININEIKFCFIKNKICVSYLREFEMDGTNYNIKT